MASRIDSFSDVPDSGRVPNVYGQKLKQQVEERLEFYRTGAAPKKNIDVMHAAMKEAEAEEGGASAEADGEKKKKEKKVDYTAGRGVHRQQRRKPLTAPPTLRYHDTKCCGLPTRLSSCVSFCLCVYLFRRRRKRR